MEIPFENIPKSHQDYLLRLKDRLDELEEMRNEILDFQAQNEPDDLIGSIEFRLAPIYLKWEASDKRGPTDVEDFWYASDQDC